MKRIEQGGVMQYFNGALFGDLGDYAPARLEQHAAEVPAFALWRAGNDPIQDHSDTQALVMAMAADLVARELQPDVATVYDLLHDLDRLTAAAMWVVVHMTYAQRVRIDGQPLQAEDFKEEPEGHAGGSLTKAPGYGDDVAWSARDGDTRA